jgi:hypothetical protein
MTLEEAISAVKRLQNFEQHEVADQAANKFGYQSSTFAVFLMLTNNLEGGVKFEPNYLGHLEADLLAQALAGWASYPHEVNWLIDSECL